MFEMIDVRLAPIEGYSTILPIWHEQWKHVITILVRRTSTDQLADLSNPQSTISHVLNQQYLWKIALRSALSEWEADHWTKT